ncbi:unnamed protein product [Auanema sp. JU1783]|nr:unnamed protein product [Auanema sp. JU1783]
MMSHIFARLSRNKFRRHFVFTHMVEIAFSCFLVLITLHQIYGSNTIYIEWNHDKVYKELGELVVNTNKGWISYSELEENVFRPMKYEILKPTVPIPTLRRIEPASCAQIFGDWLRFIETAKYKGPQYSMPEELENMYTLNGYIRKSRYYRDDAHSSSSERVWDQIDEWRNLTEEEFIAVSNYGKTSMAVYHSLKAFPLVDQYGAVFGSLTPWAESMALQAGAREVLTIEYLKLKIEGKSNVHYKHPLDFARNFESYLDTFDFVISFSSLEHSGLGRYGDSLDPNGDLRELQKIHCALKPGGLLFLGLPRGQDILNYNVHRIYGRIRLAMIMEGYELLATFRENYKHPRSLSLHDFDAQQSASGGEQDLYVLRKRRTKL